MKIEMGKQYRTRDGREVRIYAVDGGGDWPIHGAVKNIPLWTVNEWAKSGMCEGDRYSDLIENKSRHKGWVNVYEVHETKEIADALGGDEENDERLACLEIEFEEGDGL